MLNSLVRYHSWLRSNSVWLKAQDSHGLCRKQPHHSTCWWGVALIVSMLGGIGTTPSWAHETVPSTDRIGETRLPPAILPPNSTTAVSLTPSSVMPPSLPSTFEGNTPILVEPLLVEPFEPTPLTQAPPNPNTNDVDVPPEVLEQSPVLRRWLHEVPDVMDDIAHDPSFRTRLRLGYAHFPSTGHRSGFDVGVEDIFIGRTGLTVSGDYHQSWQGERRTYGADMQYYLLPLGGYVNVAPVLGYRYFTVNQYTTSGVNVGLRLRVIPSRTGASDITLTQSWVSPGSQDEVGLTTLSVGYAVTRHLRLSTDIQAQNSRGSKDSRVGVALEWML